jgi:hypothetical protein
MDKTIIVECILQILYVKLLAHDSVQLLGITEQVNTAVLL